MHKMMMMGAAMLAAATISGAATATPIAAGGSVAAAPITTTNAGSLASYVNVAFTSQAPAGQASTFSGTYSEVVYRDSANTLCGMTGMCLSFGIQLTNNSTSTDGIETVTTGPFSSLFTYNVGYVAVNSGIAPLYINDSATGTISFNFTAPGNTSNLIMPGRTSDVLIIQTSATNFRAGNLSFQDNQTATVAGFIPTAPAVPEPASWALMIGGFGLTGAAMRRRKAVVKFA